MDLTFGTPALVFPAISLLLLAYTNRYMAIVSRLRQLAGELADPTEMSDAEDVSLTRQIATLRKRIGLIRGMQTLAVLCMLAAVVAMLFIALDVQTAAKWAFYVGLVAFGTSLVISLYEIQLSNNAVDEQLASVERRLATRRRT